MVIHMISFYFKKLYLHPIYLSIHPIKNTHRGKYKFTLKPILYIYFFFFFSSLCSPQLSYYSEVASFEKIVRMTLKNSENDVEIIFKTMEKEDEKVDNIQVHFFFRKMYLIRIRKSGYHNILWILKSGIYSTTGFNKFGSQTISRISKSGLDCYFISYKI